MEIKCYALVPKVSHSETRLCLDNNHISYSYSEFDNRIFANMREIPVELFLLAEVDDPVFNEGDKWFFKISEDEIKGPFDSEDKARRLFVNYISSWFGEFVNSADA